MSDRMTDYCCHGLIKCPACWTEDPKDAAAEIERLKAALRAVIAHWDEFEHGFEFESVIDTARKALEGKDAQEA